jgi:hypothetical protein
VQDGPDATPARRASPGRRLVYWSALALAALFAPAAVAQTYTVAIHPTLNDLDIAIEPVSTSTMLVVRLTNRSALRVRCRLRYDAPPQTPSRDTVRLDPGATRQSVLRAQRKWFNVDVQVECAAMDGQAPQAEGSKP